MTNSFNEVNEQMTEIQQNLTQAVEIAKEVPSKISQMIEEKKNLEQENEEIKKVNTDLKNQVSTLKGKLADELAEFNRKQESSENEIIYLQRELDLDKDDLNKLRDQLKAKDGRINILESQKQELTDSLRQSSS